MFLRIATWGLGFPGDMRRGMLSKGTLTPCLPQVCDWQDLEKVFCLRTLTWDPGSVYRSVTGCCWRGA